MPAGGTIVVHNLQGDVNAYAPARNQPPNEYTVAQYGGGPKAVDLKVGRLLVTAQSLRPGVQFLIRAPKGGTLDLNTNQGAINVADFEGVVNAHSDRGDVKMLIPQYGNVSVGTGNISVIFASTDWPGTLNFSAVNGNVELYVNQYAKAHVRLHTADGTVFSDFPLRGTSAGTSETIDSSINGGGPRSIDVEVQHGGIRLMQLKPQI